MPLLKTITGQALKKSGEILARIGKSFKTASATTMAKRVREKAEWIQKTGSAAAGQTKNQINDFVDDYTARSRIGRASERAFHVLNRPGVRTTAKRIGNVLGWMSGVKIAAGVGKTAIRHPIWAGGIAGAATGYGKYVLNQADQRTQNLQNRGMPANNLGTDGLTLALSRNRHK